LQFDRNTELLQGLTIPEFLDQEQERLDYVLDKISQGGPIVFQEMIELAIIACCAISSLVAGGRLEQDEFNGDKFFHQMELAA